jgi:hypothetical protein
VSDEEMARAIRRIDPLERKIGLIGAGIAILAAIASTVPYIDNPKRSVTLTQNPTGSHHKTCTLPYVYEKLSGSYTCVSRVTYSRAHWITELLIILIFPLAMLLCIKIGRRAPLAFTMLMTGFAIEATIFGIVGLAYIVGGGWLIVRAWRVQKYGTTNGKEVARIAGERSAQRKAAKQAGLPPPSKSSKSSSNGNAAPKAPPQANKRYTPKTPQKKRPPAPQDS